MLSAKDLRLTRGAQLILDGISLSAGPGARLGVVGPNGIGKSTLLRVLAGMQAPDSGVVERSPASLAVGYVAQGNDADPGESLTDYLARRTGVAAAEAEFDRLTEELAAGGDVNAYSEALDRYLALGGHDLASRAAVVAADLGLGDRMDVVVAELSGGQQARARLAGILLSRFDVYLLDEPTNDLDFAGLDRLESFLKELSGAVVVVSHDRAFLDRSVTRVLEIEERTHRGVEYAGAWSEYVQRRNLAHHQHEQRHDKWTRQRDDLQERLVTQRKWSETGVRRQQRSPRDKDKKQAGARVERSEQLAGKVRITERQLSRLGQVEKPWEGWELRLDLAPTTRSGDRVAALSAAVAGRGSWRIGPVDLEVAWADRIAVTGPNGAGKTTLLGMLLGEVALLQGSGWVGPGVRVGRMDQHRADVGTGATVLDSFVAHTGQLPVEGRRLLAKFGIGADHVDRAVAGLSPGERTRLQMAALVGREVNCLVLDEPTNHLDLPAIEQLESALDTWTGTLLVVSHDRWLLDRLHVNRRLVVEDGGVCELDPED